MDVVERDYEVAIRAAVQRGDQEKAIDLAQGLKEYQELYQIPPGSSERFWPSRDERNVSEREL